MENEEQSIAEQIKHQPLPVQIAIVGYVASLLSAWMPPVAITGFGLSTIILLGWVAYTVLS